MQLLIILIIITIDNIFGFDCGGTCGVVSPVKDVQYFRQLWLDNLMRAYTWSRKDKSEEFSNRFSNVPKFFGSFDFVIIGGGNSGSVLANRLSENMKWKILLLEIGSDDNDLTLMPGALPILANSDYNWGYLTKPQKRACFAMENNQCGLNRGKYLGGDTMVSSEVYMRARKSDFDKWSKIGSKWNYADCLFYYKKVEGMIWKNKQIGFNMKEGNETNNYSAKESELINHIIEANKELGYKEVDYNNVQNPIGVSRMKLSLRNGIKKTASEVYLKPIRDFRKNLFILTKALPIKINFMHNSIATGLIFMHEANLYNITIRKELLICAGGYNTPQLLMLSGIGPKEHLASFGIPSVIDLPVGKNLINRPHIDLRIKTNLTHQCGNLENNLYDYINGKGVLATPITKAVTFGKIYKTKDSADYMVLYNAPYEFTDATLYKKMYNFGNIMDANLQDRQSSDIIVRVTHLNPNSRGTVKLRSNNPVDHIEIDPDYLNNMSDFDSTYQSIKSTLNILDTHAFKSIGATLGGFFIPACDNFTEIIFWHCIATYLMDGIGDPMGTCKMGNGRDAVVDQNLIVHGCVNVRVVDASAIPFPISAHSRSTEMMMGEKIADVIKMKYGKK